MMTEVTTEAVMGVNMNCVRCHDHKFDPFLQKDYYRIMAIYRPVFDPDPVFPPPADTNWLPANVGSGSWPARFLLNAGQTAIDRFIEAQTASPTRSEVKAKQSEVTTDWRRKQYQEMDEPLRSRLLAILDTPSEERTASETALLGEQESRFRISAEELAALYPDFAAMKAEHERNNAPRQGDTPRDDLGRVGRDHRTRCPTRPDARQL